jgi:hypothetical protein
VFFGNVDKHSRKLLIVSVHCVDNRLLMLWTMSTRGQRSSQNLTCILSSLHDKLNINEQAVLPFRITKHEQDLPCGNIKTSGHRI